MNITNITQSPLKQLKSPLELLESTKMESAKPTETEFKMPNLKSELLELLEEHNKLLKENNRLLKRLLRLLKK